MAAFSLENVIFRNSPAMFFEIPTDATAVSILPGLNVESLDKRLECPKIVGERDTGGTVEFLDVIQRGSQSNPLHVVFAADLILIVGRDLGKPGKNQLARAVPDRLPVSVGPGQKICKDRR